MLSSFSTFQSLLENTESAPVVSSLEIPNKIVYYSFENTSGTTVNGEWNPINATASSSALISNADKVKGSFSGAFTSTIAMQLPYNTFYQYFTPANGVTFSLFLKRTGTPSGDTHVIRWISSNYSTNGGLALLYRPSNNTYGFGSVWTNSNMFNLPNTGGLNTWCHVVLIATIDNRLTVYVNGSIVKNLNNVDLFNVVHGNPSVIPTTTTNSASDFYFGGLPPNAQRYIGFIDEIKIYNKILTQAEVTAIHTGNDI
jgi:hypothetical protein